MKFRQVIRVLTNWIPHFSIVSHIIKAAQSKNTAPVGSNMAPALIETYSRLLVYTEIESLGIKGFLSKNTLKTFRNETKLIILLKISQRSTFANGI